MSIRNYPRNWIFHNQLGLVYVDLGQYDEGLKEGLEAARLQAIEPPYRRQLDAYICQNHLPEAKQLAEKLVGNERSEIAGRIANVDEQVRPAPTGSPPLDMVPDGKRFAILPRSDPTEAQGRSVLVTFLLNFLDELRRRVPAGK